ncbi:MAG: hypothetical protein WC959_05000 [Kiritimatiellales bacterium]
MLRRLKQATALWLLHYERRHGTLRERSAKNSFDLRVNDAAGLFGARLHWR